MIGLNYCQKYKKPVAEVTRETCVGICHACTFMVEGLEGKEALKKRVSEMDTIYPRAKFANVNTGWQQLEHLESELQEFKKAIDWVNFDHAAEELCDLIHSAETMLYILAERYKVDVAKIQQEVVEKNQARGYYSE